MEVGVSSRNMIDGSSYPTSTDNQDMRVPQISNGQQGQEKYFRDEVSNISQTMEGPKSTSESLTHQKEAQLGEPSNPAVIPTPMGAQPAVYDCV